MSTQRIGILYPVKSKITIQAVMQAINQFYHTPHTTGWKPAEIHLNPDEIGKISQIDGFKVVSDERVRPRYIRVTTVPMEVRDV